MAVKGGSSIRSVVKSVLRPGVELASDESSINVIARLSDIARGEVAGYNASVLGSYRQLFPRLSKKDYAKLSYTDLPDSPVSLAQVLGGISGLRPADIRDFSLARRLARQTLSDGSYRDVVVPNIKALATEMDLADYNELEGLELEIFPDLKSRSKTRTYTLTQVMSDMDVKQKYHLPTRVYVTGERLAATDAPAAAQVFQDAMNAVQDHTRVIVNPGLLAIDNVQAANAIRMMAYGLPAMPTSVRCDLVVGKVFMYAPDESEVAWHVLGPMRRMAEVAEVYRIVMALGPVLPSGLLAVDLVQLQIDIFDGQTYTEPVLTFNAASGHSVMASAGLAPAAAREMTTLQRSMLEGMSNKLLPILTVGGDQLATAVRVTDRHVLVNDHVHAADPGATIGGAKISLTRRVARDLWAAECVGSAAPWACRDPVVGESAIIVYTVNGVVSCTSPVIVQSVTSSTVMTSGSVDVVGGVSGGALVAMSDFALFGIHSATVGSGLLNYRFGPDQLQEVVNSDGVAPVSRVEQNQSFASVVLKRFIAKGLSSTFKSVCSEVVSLWSGSEHKGMAFLDSGIAYAAGLPAGQYTNHDGSQQFVFSSSEAGVLRANCPWSDLRVPYRRKPKVGEKVFIVGRDYDLYLTNAAEVLHVYANGKGFVISNIQGLDKPIVGGAVVTWDGAVVGLARQDASVDTPVGFGIACGFIPYRAVTGASGIRSVLASQFPFLRMELWPDDVLTEVLSHDNAEGSKQGNASLALVGKLFLQYLNSKIMREYDISELEWGKIMVEMFSSSKVASKVVASGLGECFLSVEDGCSAKDIECRYEKTMYALIAAASLVESEIVVLKLASAMSLIYTVDASESVVGVSEAAVD